MRWVQAAVSAAFLGYVALAVFRMIVHGDTVGDAFTPRWVSRLYWRRVMRRQREEYLRRTGGEPSGQ